MTDIRKSLESLADAIEQIENRPVPLPKINDRELSGNKIHGGKITKFSSTGILDQANNTVLLVKNDGIQVDVVTVDKINSNSKLLINTEILCSSDLEVNGSITAKKLHVNELTADIRNERTEPLVFLGSDVKSSAYGKGLIWPGGKYTKQFVLSSNPDRFFSTENIDLMSDRSILIDGQMILSKDSIGPTVTKSNLKSVGRLDKLEVNGFLSIDDYLFYDPNTQRLGLGIESPNGRFSLLDNEHEFVIDSGENKKFKIGSYTTTGLDIITDDTDRISIDATGAVTIHNKLTIKDKLGVGVKNFATDADITSAGPIRFQNKKFEVGESEPLSGNYIKGDIVWNSDPKPTGNVGWICVRSGTPGEWKAFGQIFS